MTGRRVLVLTLLPLTVGAAAALPFSIGWLANPTFYLLRADLASLLLFVGWLCSGLVAFLLLRERQTAAGARRSIDAVRTAQAEEHHLFLFRLDHELKNPLQALRNALANVGLDALSPEQEQALDIARDQALHLSRLVTDLRNLDQLETAEIEQKEVPVGAVLEAAIKVAQTGVRDVPAIDAGHSLVLNIQETAWPPVVLGDRDLLQLAVYNLIGNACKFSPPGSPVEIWALPEDSMVRIDVIDRGQGIPAEDLPHMGEVLYRGRTARDIPGSGLGLALVRTVVAKHGGRFTMRSQPGECTVATIRLPLVPGSGSQASTKEVQGRENASSG